MSRFHATSLFIFLIVSELTGFGQATSAIVGSVTDSSGALMPGVTVTATNPATGEKRSLATNQAGVYLFSSLQPGDYDVSAEMTGFKKTVKRAAANGGREVTVDFALEVGEASQTINVAAEVSAINLVDSKVDAIIDQNQISDLPLNGRSAYEMAKLVPGVVVSNAASRNADNQISIAGHGPGDTRFSVDGINISDLGSGGGEGINLSQEVVREFQVSINNSDPSIGISSSGAINLVTRSGTNDFHGSLFAFFRNSQYSAFPGLARPVLKPNPNNDPSIAAVNETQTNPPLWRRQFGGMVSGPIFKDRLFGLASIEYSQQATSGTFDTGSADLAAFNQIGSYSRTRQLQNYRLDWHATDKHSFFLRLSSDRLVSLEPGSTSVAATWPSRNVNKDYYTYSVLAAWTAVWTPNLVGDVRVGFTRVYQVRGSVDESLQEGKLYAPQFTRMGIVTVSGTSMIFGNEPATPNNVLGVQPQFVNNFTYTHGKNTWRFGANFSPLRYWSTRQSSFPFSATVFNPTQARQAGISIPSTFTTIGDLMLLPVASVTLAYNSQGRAGYLYPQTINGNDLIWNPEMTAYVGDSYRPTQRLTLNLSLGYTYNSATVSNRDLARPKSIAALLDGGNVSPPKVKKDAFSPSVGFAWDPRGGGKTVIRGGFGVYWASDGPLTGLGERPLLAPLGAVYVSIPGSAITNPVTGKGTLSFGSAVANATAGIFRLTDFVSHATQMTNLLAQTTFSGANANPSVTNFDFFKGSSTALNDSNLPATYSLQYTLGVQRQIGTDWLLEGNAVFNVGNHTSFTSDRNRQFRPLSLGGPVLPAFGQVSIVQAEGKSNYRGLLLSAKKRLSHRVQISASYTLSSYRLIAGSLVNYNDFNANWGYDSANPRHGFNASAVFDLPWSFQVALLSSMQSMPPLNLTLNGIDLDGDGTTNDQLPGLSLNCLNKSCGVGDLRNAVATFNQTYAGKKDARGTTIQPINLPATFSTGDGVLTQDVRLTKKIKIGEKFNVSLIGECFNVFNIANLTYASTAGNLYSSGFGLPNGRQGFLFGSAGPRAFQFAARMSF